MLARLWNRQLLSGKFIPVRLVPQKAYVVENTVSYFNKTQLHDRGGRAEVQSAHKFIEKRKAGRCVARASIKALKVELSSNVAQLEHDHIANLPFDN